MCRLREKDSNPHIRSQSQKPQPPEFKWIRVFADSGKNFDISFDVKIVSVLFYIFLICNLYRTLFRDCRIDDVSVVNRI